jgi:tetratricopeptide (TPR) repeat protein
VKSVLPTRIFASIAAVAAVVILAFILFPGWSVLVLASLVFLTLVGGVMIAGEASKKAGSRPDAAYKVLAGGTGRFWLVWAITTSVLWVLSAPDVYFRDGGELTGAVVVLGVPHPTGFPLLCLIGKLASLFPIGNVYFRLNLLSGLAAGGTAAFAWLFAGKIMQTRESRSEPLWWVAPAVLLGSATVWLHATTPEIYSLSLLGLAATLCLAVEGARRHDARLIVAAAALCGIGAGGHITWPLYGAPVLLLCFAWFVATSDSVTSSRSAVFFRLGVCSVFAVVAGMAVVLYLPVAAGRDPLMNWGDPSSSARFIAHLTGQRIRDSFAPQMSGFNSAVFAANLSMAWRTFLDSTGPMLVFAAFGVVAAVRTSAPAAIALVAVVVGDFLFAVFVNPMGIRDLQVLLPATWATAVLAGIGASAMARRLSARAGFSGTAAVTGLVAILLVFQWVSSPADRDMTNVYGPKEITDQILDSAGPDATVLAASDDMASSLLGRSAAEDARPDMIFLVKQHLGDAGFVQRRVNPYQAALSETDPGRLAVLESIRKRPFESDGESPSDAVARAAATFATLGEVWIEPGEGVADSGVRSVLRADFPLWKFDPDMRASPITVRDAWRKSMNHRSGLDRWGRAYLADWIRLLGTWEAMKQETAGATAILRSAVSLNPEDYRASHNLGVVISDSGSPDKALPYLIAAVSENPGYIRGWETLAKTALKAGRPDLAVDARARAEALKARAGQQ